MGVLKIRNSANTAWLEVGGTVGAENPSMVADADGDTKVQCEESGDEDIIRMDAGGNERFWLKGSGVHRFSNSSRVQVRKLNTQSVSNDTQTVVEYDDVVVDPQNEFDAVTNKGRFTASEDGTYVVTGVMMYVSTAWAGGTYAQACLFVNGSQVRTLRYHVTTARTMYFAQPFSYTVDLDANDYLEISAHHQEGATQTVYFTAANVYCHLDIQKIA